VFYDRRHDRRRDWHDAHRDVVVHHVVKFETERLEHELRCARTTEPDQRPPSDLVRDDDTVGGCRFDPRTVDVRSVGATAIDEIARTVGMVEEHGMST